MIDGAEAIRLMRKHAKEWNFDENNVGIMGFSAGGHLASTLMVSEKASVRPDFGILFYPVISMKKELTHKARMINCWVRKLLNDLKIYIVMNCMFPARLLLRT